MEVADKVFAAEGMGVPTDEIARRAGVGPGYMAVAVKRITESIAEARRLGDSKDASEGLFAYLRSLGAQFQARRNLIEVMAAGGQSLHVAHPELAKELNDAVGALLRRAQAAGSVRKDVSAADVMNLVVGVYGAMSQVNRSAEDAARLLKVVFDGLRADARPSKRRAPR